MVADATLQFSKPFAGPRRVARLLPMWREALSGWRRLMSL